MDGIRDQVQETAKRIKRLGESSQEIGDIIEVQISELLLLGDAAIFGARKLIAVFQKALSVGIEPRRRRVANGTVQVVLPGKCWNRLSGWD